MDAVVSLGQLKTRILRSARWTEMVPSSCRRIPDIYSQVSSFVAYVANVTLMNRAQLLPLFVILIVCALSEFSELLSSG